MDSEKLVEWYEKNLDTFHCDDRDAVETMFKDGLMLEKTLIDGIIYLLENDDVEEETLTRAFGIDWMDEVEEVFSAREIEEGGPHLALVDTDGGSK